MKLKVFAGGLALTRLLRPWLLPCRLWLVAGLLSFGSFAHAGTKTDDILVVDQVAGTDGRGALLTVDPKTGLRTVLTDFGNPAQGHLGVAPVSIAIGATGRIFVSDLFAGTPDFGGALFEVNPETGNRVVISNFGQGEFAGPLSYGLGSDIRGQVFAVKDLRAVVGIAPVFGAQSLVSDFANTAQGAIEPDRVITDLVLDPSGSLLVSTARFDLPLSSAIYRVNPVTGARSLLSDFQNSSQGADVGDLSFALGMAAEKSGTLLVASGGTIAAPRNLLLRIDLKNGQRTVVSNFDNAAQGVTGMSLKGVVVEKNGKLVVGSGNASVGATDATILFRVHPKTGQRELLSDSDNQAQGPAFHAIVDIAVMP